MKMKTYLFAITLMAVSIVAMSCIGCQSKEKRQYIDSLINVAGSTDDSYSEEEALHAITVLLEEEGPYLSKKDLERLKEINEQKIKELEEKKAADTTNVDTSAVTRGESESEGFGRCFESGCYCKAFKGKGQTCQNCGHAYRRHY